MSVFLDKVQICNGCEMCAVQLVKSESKE